MSINKFFLMGSVFFLLLVVCINPEIVYSIEPACPTEQNLECEWSICWDNNDPWRGDVDTCTNDSNPYEFKGWSPYVDWRDYDCDDSSLTCHETYCDYTYGACNWRMRQIPCSQCPVGSYSAQSTEWGNYFDICVSSCGGAGAGCGALCASDADCQAGLICIGDQPEEETDPPVCWMTSICDPGSSDDKYGWVSGQVYVDLDGSGWISGQNEVFSNNTVSCSGFKDNNIKILKDSSNVLSQWYCGSNNQAYFKTSNINLGSDGIENVTLTLIPPTNYSCDMWGYTICLNSDCTQKQQGSSTGCTATIPMREGDWVNHLTYKVKTGNRPPVCDITGGATNVCTSKSYYYTSSSSDPDGDPLTYQWDDGACNGHFIAGMTDTSIYPDPTWTPPNVGGACTLNLQVADGKGGICTDSYPVSVNYNPLCGAINGPATAYINEDTQFTLTAGDLDFDTLTYTWTATCGTFVGDTNLATVTWRAPAAVGTVCTLTAKAKDECWSCYPSPTKIVTVGQRKVQGYIWEVPEGGSCGDGYLGNEIKEGDVADVTISAEGISGDWKFDGSYEVFGVPAGDRTINVNITSNGGGSFTYVLDCADSSSGAGPVVISGSSASFVVDQETENLNLGFVKKTQGWLQSDAGDIFGGGAVRSTIPSLPLGGFLPFMITGTGTAVSKEDISVGRTLGGPALTKDGYYVKEYSTASFWPLSLDVFRIPADAIQIEGGDCNKLFKDLGFRLDIYEVYKADASCINTAMNNLATPREYKINVGNDPQVSVIYVEDDEDLRFTEGFASQRVGRNLVFVVEGNVVFDSDIGSPNPLVSDAPKVQAGLIVYGGIEFESKEDEDADGYSDDLTIILEGPIAAKNGIDFLRDRGLSNDYPAIVVRYNPYYMTQLFTQEKDSGKRNYTGLMTSENSIVEWLYID